MKSGFIRALWGIYDHQGRRLYKRRTKIDYDIRLLTHNKWNEPFVTYVFGEDNYKYLTEDVGLTSSTVRLVDKRPIVWDVEKEGMRHKTEAFRLGMEEFDEIVLLDWDTQPIKPLPPNFWETLRKKQKIQAILRCYKKRKISWREEDSHRIPCASFVYIGDKDIPKNLIKTWEDMGRPWSEELCMVKYMESLAGGWPGVNKYWDMFEPDFFVLGEGLVYPWEKLHSKNHSFSHFNMKAVGTQLAAIDRGIARADMPWLIVDGYPIRNRTDVINYYLMEKLPPGDKEYLEVGVRNLNDNFNHVKALHKDGVDPDARSKANYLITSDEFFKRNTKKYDLIFIDGLHQHDQVYKDIKNSLACLKEYGIILLHDCNPPTEWHQREKESRGFWNGTVWKAFVQMRMERDDLEMFVIDVDWGVGVIIPNRKRDKFVCSENIMDYKVFAQHRKESLNLITIEEFRRKKYL